MDVKGSYPHPPNPPRPSGVTNVGWTTAIDTHNLAGTIVPKRVTPPLAPAVYQGPDIATQQRKHIGASPPYGEDTPDRGQVQRKENEGGTSAKGYVLMLICVPLPHLVLPLSGCACSGTPTKATRGEAIAKPATQILRWPSEGKGITIGVTVGIVMCQWGVTMMYRTSGHNGPPPQRHKLTKGCQRIVPSSSQPSPTFWGNQCGLDDRD